MAIDYQDAHPQQRRSRRPTRLCSARSSTGSRVSSTGGASWGRRISSAAGRLSAHRHLGRPPRAGRRSATSRCRITAGASSSPSPSRTAASASATRWASRRGSRSRASTAPPCAGSSSPRATPSPRSVEQQRLLGHTAPSLYDLRNLFQVNVEEGRHLWAMVYLLHAYFGRDGREEAEELLCAPLGRRRQAAHPRHLQRADRRLARLLHVHLLHRPRRQVPAHVASPKSASIRWRAPASFMLTEEAHHMFVGDTGIWRA